MKRKTVKAILLAVFVICPSTMYGQTVNGHEYVDLGLSVKWATCNVGASKPTDLGDYYAWGETKTKQAYTKANSQTTGKHIADINGTDRDVAHVSWGGTWRLPTSDEMNELVDKCTWEWATQDGKLGYKVTSLTNGNSIFLPSGYYGGEYWTSTSNSSLHIACKLYFTPSYHCVLLGERSSGLAVRPVSEYSQKKVPTPVITTSTSGTISGHEYVDLGLSVKWATCNVGATSPSGRGSYFAWGETATKSVYEAYTCKTRWKEVDDIAGNSSYDAAKAIWGGTWRMPTKTEIQELVDNCIWNYTHIGKCAGYRIVSKKNGNFIFIPAAGCREDVTIYDRGKVYYWSSTPHGVDGAYCLDNTLKVSHHGRGYGYTIRPVSE